MLSLPASRMTSILIASLVLIVLCPALAAAHGVDADAAAAGPDAEPTAHGLYEVQLSGGARLLTHGQDAPPPASEGVSARAAAVTTRAPHCADQYALHLLYARPIGAPDRFETVRP